MQAIRGLAVTLFLLGGASAESCGDKNHVSRELDCAGVCGGNNEMHDCGIPTQICGKPGLCPSGFERREGALWNPFHDIASVGKYSFPVFVDEEGDGDLDLVIGRSEGDLFYYENTGSASYPSYTSRGYFAGINVGSNSAPAFVDTDNDGDLDLVIGRGAGDLFYYENTASASNPSYTNRTGALNPFAGISVGSNSVPVFVDTDNDGDLDLVIGSGAGGLQYYYENIGSWDAATPRVFTPYYKRRTGAYNPFHGISSSTTGSVPAFVDTDNDGDMDLVIGRFAGDLIYYYENTGSASNPFYTRRTKTNNPFQGVDVVSNSAPVFVDTDNDGDLDLVVGEKAGGLQFYMENIGNTLSNNAFAVFKAARNSMLPTELLIALSANQSSSCQTAT